MKFCKFCERLIKKSIINNEVVYKCHCGNIEKTLSEDVLISNITLNMQETTDLYDNLIKLAPFDRTNQLVKNDMYQMWIELYDPTEIRCI